MSNNTTGISIAIKETLQKVESALLPLVVHHVSGTEFQPEIDGLDFLDVKNSLVVTYLIEYVYRLRMHLQQISQAEETENNEDALQSNLCRLNETRVVLDKIRGMDKKLRYQIDKILSSGINAGTFVSATTTSGGAANDKVEDDPLQYHPRLLYNDDDDADNIDSRKLVDIESDHDAQNNATIDNTDDDEIDEDLATVRANIEAAQAFTSDRKRKKSLNNSEDDDGMPSERKGDGAQVYRAPRITAVPYRNVEKEDREAQRNKEYEKRRMERARASEMAQALRSQYGDKPEQEDIYGGTDLGQQRAASRELARREMMKTKYEEDAMVRLITTRAEKKERKRIMRTEQSNLTAISDLGNLTRDSSEILGFKGGKSDSIHEQRRHTMASDGVKNRYNKGDVVGTRPKQRPKAPRNPYAAALFSRDDGGRSAKKKGKSR
jgi:hypothetical protein